MIFPLFIQCWSVDRAVVMLAVALSMAGRRSYASAQTRMLLVDCLLGQAEIIDSINSNGLNSHHDLVKPLRCGDQQFFNIDNHLCTRYAE